MMGPRLANNLLLRRRRRPLRREVLLVLALLLGVVSALGATDSNLRTVGSGRNLRSFLGGFHRNLEVRSWRRD